MSKGDPMAWGLLGFSLVICGTVFVVRQQAWFINGGAKARNAAIAVMTVLSILAVIAAVTLKRVWHVGAISNDCW